MKNKPDKNTLNQLTALINRSFQAEEAHEQELPKLEIAPKSMKKFEALMQLEKITLPDLDVLTEEETHLFTLFLTEMFEEKKDTDLDVFVEKVDNIILPYVKEDIRDNNHLKINNAIVDSLKKYGRMPGKSEIARATGLSRNTVQKHMKEFNGTDDFKDRIKEYQYAKTNIVESIIKAAVNGDMRAAKLYMSTVAKLPQTNTTVINQQNNFIQMNGVTVNFAQLPADKQEQIKEIISGVLVVKEE